MDPRDKPTWVVLELSKAGDAKAADGKLDAILRRDLRVDADFPIFIPYALFDKGGRKVSIRLVDGYAFVSSTLPETRYFKLENSPFVEVVLSTKNGSGVRVLQTVADSHVQELRERLRRELEGTIEVGTDVRILKGNYANLTGPVVDVFSDRVAVHIPLRSREIVAVVPKTYVDVLGENNPLLTTIDHGKDIESVDMDIMDLEFYEK